MTQKQVAAAEIFQKQTGNFTRVGPRFLFVAVLSAKLIRVLSFRKGRKACKGGKEDGTREIGKFLLLSKHCQLFEVILCRAKGYIHFPIGKYELFHGPPFFYRPPVPKCSLCFISIPQSIHSWKGETLQEFKAGAAASRNMS